MNAASAPTRRLRYFESRTFQVAAESVCLCRRNAYPSHTAATPSPANHPGTLRRRVRLFGREGDDDTPLLAERSTELAGHRLACCTARLTVRIKQENWSWRFAWHWASPSPEYRPGALQPQRPCARTQLPSAE